MRQMVRAIILARRKSAAKSRYEQIRFVPEPPPGFVRRSDPNFYFLARKF